MFGIRTSLEGSLFDTFRRLEREMDELFGLDPRLMSIRSVARGAFPDVNVGATADQVDVYFYAAGIDPKALDISIQKNLLTVSGARPEKEVKDANFYRKERFAGEFRRAITLPEDVDPERVEASYKDGILHITVQRRETAKPRQIQVK